MEKDDFKIDMKRYKLLLKRANKSETYLMADLGLSQATFYRRIKTVWSKTQILAMCFLLDTTPEELLEDDTEFIYTR